MRRGGGWGLALPAELNGVPELIAYHDTEWGVPEHNDQRLFEKICLEAFQCGLSWRTVLAKRARFRIVFCDFDFDKVANFTQADVQRLLQDAGIIRHRGKIEAVIHNASRALSRELKRRGWKFVGPTTMYALMQSMGLINDHEYGCFRR